MVGKQQLVLEEILTQKQINRVLRGAIGQNVQCKLKSSEVRPAVDGIAGFLGDHLKAVLHVDVNGEEKKVHLFMKRVPVVNQAKAEFITESNFFKREQFMYKLLDDMCKEDENPWCVKAYVYSDSMFVMPDLVLEGYSTKNFLDTLDLQHILLTTKSLACFHAAFVNYETKKSLELKSPFKISKEFGHILTEPQFCDSPWLRTGAKVSVKFLEKFSTKSYHTLPDFEPRLTKMYIEACDRLTEYKDTVNVIVHKDLWINNIMFKYENDVPVNALLVDYQALRYAPPAFDIILLLYLTTGRSFRQEKEKDICQYYYNMFVKNLNDDSKKRMKDLGYDNDDFFKWCEKARGSAMIIAIGLFPFILMDPKSAQKAFDDPETSEKHLCQDRSEPVLNHAAMCETYKRRNLEVTEEFIETYMLKQE